MADSGKHRPRLSALALGLPIVFPALWLGGVPAVVVPLLVGAVLLLWIRLCHRMPTLRVPPVAWVGFGLSVVSLLQAMPLHLRPWLAPDVAALVDQALTGLDVTAWPSLSVSPPDTAMEAARLAALALLTIAAAQLAWRFTAVFVAVVGSLVAGIGLLQQALDIDAIYGVYHARDIDLSKVAHLVGTFVNPNHQSGLLLLGLACAAALAVDQHRKAVQTSDPALLDVHGDRAFAAMGSLVLQLSALILSLSRGALIAFILSAPVALVIAAKARIEPRRTERRRIRQLTPHRLLGLAALLGLFALSTPLDAWRELSTLLDPHAGRTDEKVRVALASLELVRSSPIVGLGPGGFVDVFGAIDPEPSHVVAVHLETAPLAMMVRWGPAVGVVTLIFITLWWVHAMRHSGAHRDGGARRIALLGLAALALQQLGDFSLEFSGVAAPACALAGALSPKPSRTWTPARARRIGVTSLGIALVLSWVSLPHVWSSREAENARVREGARPVDAELRWRPLDARLHRIAARRAARRGDWAEAATRAEAATILRPGDIDGWLLRSAAERAQGRELASLESMQHALAVLHAPVPPELIEHLVERFDDPRRLGALTPDDGDAWRLLVSGLRRVSLDHATAVASAYARRHPEDPEPRRILANIASQRGRSALALHHARRMLALAPDDPQAVLTLARALKTFRPPRHAEIVELIDDAPVDPASPAPRVRAQLDLVLAEALVGLSDPASIERARALLPGLLEGPRPDAERQRIAKIVQQLEGESH